MHRLGACISILVLSTLHNNCSNNTGTKGEHYGVCLVDGTCRDGLVCDPVINLCISPEEDCIGRACGLSPNAGHACGTCPGETEWCTDEGRCLDDCADLECGPSPIPGIACGTCPGPTDLCTEAGHCVDDCARLECGLSAILEIDCGTCPEADSICSESGRCLDPGVEWVAIPGGTYEMGHAGLVNDETPVHTVNLQSFEIMKTEVTVSMFHVCVMDAEHCSPPETSLGCNWGLNDRLNHPVNCLSFFQALAFCEWLGGRIPSEAEWEYAARSAGQVVTFPWGETVASCSFAVMSDGGDGCGMGSTWPVCSKPRGHTEHGLCDLAGNVGEWVMDYYHPSYDGAPNDGSAWLDPVSHQGIVRGGAWVFDGGKAFDMRVTRRAGDMQGVRRKSEGFRCVR